LRRRRGPATLPFDNFTLYIHQVHYACVQTTPFSPDRFQ
jgi:hypothetical protein